MSDEQDVKCARCGQVKRRSEFNRNRTSANGLQRCCRPCQIENNREWAARRPEMRYEQLRRDYAKHGRRPSKDSPPEGRRAQRILERAVKAGKVHRPTTCTKCGDSGRIHGHHDDYSRPLDVSWLCSRCHMRLHRDERRAAAEAVAA